MPPPIWWLIAGAVVAATFALRLYAHAGRRPIGLDTWYYLAYADAVRRRPSFDVRLPQYLLQDERQSYPPVFPTLLALLPAAWLRRHFRVVSPLFECTHALMLSWMTWRATGSVTVSSIVALAFASTPQSIAEPRGLNPKSLSMLLYSLAMVLAIECAMTGGRAAWLAASLSGAAVFLASAAMSAAYGVILALLSLVLVDGRYFLIACSSLVGALLLSGGHYIRVVGNYLHAVRYWRRHHNLFGAHPIRHSPLYGKPHLQARPVALPQGLLGHGKLAQLLRLLGDNPFVVVLAVTPTQPAAAHYRTWALALAAVAVVSTLVPGLRSFGLGRSYIRAAAFPTLYVLAISIGGTQGLVTLVGLATVTCLCLSLSATVFFLRRLRSQRVDVETTETDGLEEAVRCLTSLPPGSVLCLPYIHSGYVGYTTGKAILWGGHCGDLRRLEPLAPVISRPIPGLMKQHGARYLVLDLRYAQPSDIGLDHGFDLEGRWGNFGLWSLCD